MNFSTPGSVTPVDHWHNDSIAFAGVVVISDMTGMVGELVLHLHSAKFYVVLNRSEGIWSCTGVTRRRASSS